MPGQPPARCPPRPPTPLRPGSAVPPQPRPPVPEGIPPPPAGGWRRAAGRACRRSRLLRLRPRFRLRPWFRGPGCPVLRSVAGFRPETEAVAEPPDGLDEQVRGPVLDLAPQVLHVGVDRPGVAEVAVAPDLLGQLQTGEQPARLGSEAGE